MHRPGLLVLLLVAVVSGPTQMAAAAGASQGAAPAAAVSPQRALVNQYCITCHSERRRVAGLTLDTANVDAVGAQAATWEKVVAKLNANAMPPVGSPRPSEDARQAFVSWLEHELDRAAAARPFVGPTSPFHRLNRTEYQNTIRDLFGLEIDAAAYLPGDDAAYGFDNNAEVLSMSPTLFDGYLAAASRISQLAVGDVTMAPVLTSFRFPTQLLQQGRTSDDLPFGSRGGLAVTHYFPVDGEYEFRLRLQRNYVNYIRGLGAPQQLDVRVDGRTATVLTDLFPRKALGSVVGIGGMVGSTCTITATAASITVGTTTISSGTDGRVLTRASGVLAEYTISGTGSAGMEAAIDKLSRVYAKAGVPERFHGSFHDLPHSFIPAMQEEAFAWLDRWL